MGVRVSKPLIRMGTVKFIYDARNGTVRPEALSATLADDFGASMLEYGESSDIPVGEDLYKVKAEGGKP